MFLDGIFGIQILMKGYYEVKAQHKVYEELQVSKLDCS